MDPTSTTTTKEILSAGLRTDDIQDAETTKNIELIGEMRIKLQQLYMKQNEVGLQQRPTQMPNNNDKAFFPATPGSSKLTRESSFFNDMKSPSYESPDNTPNINSNRKTFFPY